MSVKIGHAVHDENGGLNGIIGDQTGKEVLISKWYVSGDGWSWYIEAKDPALREHMAVLMEQACANPNIGYSRTNRYAWYNSAKANGGDVTKAKGDCDCSSLVSGIANLAGANVTNRLATASMLAAFKKSGEFNVFTDAEHLKTDKLSRRGGIFLRIGHTLMVLENGAGVEDYANEADQIEPPYVLVVGGTVNVRIAAGVENLIIYRAHKSEKLPFGEFDDDTGWYGVETPRGIGFITNKRQYTRLVEK